MPKAGLTKEWKRYELEVLHGLHSSIVFFRTAKLIYYLSKVEKTEFIA